MQPPVGGFEVRGPVSARVVEPFPGYVCSRERVKIGEIVAAGRSPVDSEETLTAEQQALEAIYLGLRTVEGIPSGVLRQLPAAWVFEEAGRLKCTPEGWLRLDSIVNDYDRATH